MEVGSVKTEVPEDYAEGYPRPPPPALHGAEVTTTVGACARAGPASVCPETMQVKQEDVDVKLEVIDPRHHVHVKQEVIDPQVIVDVKREFTDPPVDVGVVKMEPDWEDTSELNQNNLVLADDTRVKLEVEFEVPCELAGGSGTAHAGESETQHSAPEHGETQGGISNTTLVLTARVKLEVEFEVPCELAGGSGTVHAGESETQHSAPEHGETQGGISNTTLVLTARVKLEVEFEVPCELAGGSGTAHAGESETQHSAPEHGETQGGISNTTLVLTARVKLEVEFEVPCELAGGSGTVHAGESETQHSAPEHGETQGGISNTTLVLTARVKLEVEFEVPCELAGGSGTAHAGESETQHSAPEHGETQGGISNTTLVLTARVKLEVEFEVPCELAGGSGTVHAGESETQHSAPEHGETQGGISNTTLVLTARVKLEVEFEVPCELAGGSGTAHAGESETQHSAPEHGETQGGISNTTLVLTARVKLEVEFEVPCELAGGSGTAHAGESETQHSAPEHGLLVPRWSARGRPATGAAPERHALVTSGPPYSCDLCAKSYKSLPSLEKHITSHTGQKPFACDLCEWRYETLNDLKIHYKTHKGDIRYKWRTVHKNFTQLGVSTRHVGITAAYPYSCRTCDKSFSEQSDLTRHERVHARAHVCGVCGTRFLRSHQLTTHLTTHTGEKPFKCTSCEKAFAQPSALTKHERLHTGDRPYPCKVCPKRFTGPRDLKKHEKIHTGEKKLAHACNTCGRKFEKPGDLKTHLRSHTGEKPYKCGECNKEFTRLGSLTKHKRIHAGDKPYPCGMCDKRFLEKRDLMKHERVHTGDRPYPCQVCPKRFTGPNDLKKHEKIHTGEIERTHACDTCEQKFERSGDLKAHLRTHTGERPFKCGECNKEFTRLGTLTKHKRIHAGDKPYPCGVCDKRFSEKNCLMKHERLHTGDRPYACQVCPKRYTGPSELKKHEKIHTGEIERTHACDTCERKFEKSSDLKRHLRIHTGEKPYKCGECNKAFTQLGALTYHKRTHAGDKPYLYNTEFEIDVPPAGGTSPSSRTSRITSEFTQERNHTAVE